MFGAKLILAFSILQSAAGPLGFSKTLLGPVTDRPVIQDWITSDQLSAMARWPKPERPRVWLQWMVASAHDDPRVEPLLGPCVRHHRWMLVAGWSDRPGIPRLFVGMIDQSYFHMIEKIPFH